jgi:DNA polymerase III epsilon subunit-like protein
MIYKTSQKSMLVIRSCSHEAFRPTSMELRYNLAMTSLLDDIHSYISVDVETAGPIPSRYALLSIGACTIGEPRQTFYVELQPDQELEDPQAMAVHSLDLQTLKRTGLPPKDAMMKFNQWLAAVTPPGSQPLFVAFNAPFDWSFINDSFIRYLGTNPFGHSAVDIKAVYMGLSGKPWRETSGEYLHRLYNNARVLTHNAMEDAVDQAVIFEGILADFEKMNIPD